MRVVFWGTGEIAFPAFQMLLENLQDIDVVALVSQPSRPIGRHQTIHHSPLVLLALEKNLPVFQPESLRENAVIEQLKNLAADVHIVMAYGQILPEQVIDFARLAFINIHASLLPRHRGASCVQAAIAAGDDISGVTIMHVVKKLDAGDVILRKIEPVAPEETGTTLHDKLAQLSPTALLKALDLLANGKAKREPQNEAEATYAAKLKREDGRIDWSDYAEKIERKIRANHAWPGTFTMFSDAKGRQKILKIFPQTQIVPTAEIGISGKPGAVIKSADENFFVMCGCGNFLRINEVQLEGSRKMSICDFLHGHDLANLQFEISSREDGTD